MIAVQSEKAEVKNAHRRHTYQYVFVGIRIMIPRDGCKHYIITQPYRQEFSTRGTAV